MPKKKKTTHTEPVCMFCGRAPKDHDAADLLECLRGRAYVKEEENPVEVWDDAVRVAIRIGVSVVRVQDMGTFTLEINGKKIARAQSSSELARALCEHFVCQEAVVPETEEA